MSVWNYLHIIPCWTMLLFLWHFYKGWLKLRTASRWQCFDGGSPRAEQNLGTIKQIQDTVQLHVSPDSSYLTVLSEIAILYLSFYSHTPSLNTQQLCCCLCPHLIYVNWELKEASAHAWPFQGVHFFSSPSRDLLTPESCCRLTWNYFILRCLISQKFSFSCCRSAGILMCIIKPI